MGIFKILSLVVFCIWGQTSGKYDSVKMVRVIELDYATELPLPHGASVGFCDRLEGKNKEVCVIENEGDAETHFSFCSKELSRCLRIFPMTQTIQNPGDSTKISKIDKNYLMKRMGCSETHCSSDEGEIFSIRKRFDLTERIQRQSRIYVDEEVHWLFSKIDDGIWTVYGIYEEMKEVYDGRRHALDYEEGKKKYFLPYAEWKLFAKAEDSFKQTKLYWLKKPKATKKKKK